MYGLVQGVLDGGVQRQEVRDPQTVQDLGHGRLGAAQQEAGLWPVAGGLVGHGREDGGADWVQGVHAAEVADNPEWLRREVLEQNAADLGSGEQVDLAAEGDYQAAVPGRVRDCIPASPVRRRRP